MPDKYIRRSIETAIQGATREFPAVILTGPRQSGKTTILKRLFGNEYRYVSLEPPDIKEAAISDPRGFMEINGPPVIFDEVQYAPNLLPYVKERIDSERGKRGRYILSGSQNLLLIEKVTESLAGRAAVLKLLPLSFREVSGSPKAGLPWESKGRNERKKFSYLELWRWFLRGGYPELNAEPNRDIRLWHSSYLQTYLERDIRTIRQVGDLSQFRNFLVALAARSGQLLNLSELAGGLGIATNTARKWLSVLEATHQVVILRPYFANIGKRLVKTPKVYFADTGTLCSLLNIHDPTLAPSTPQAGAVMETAVLSEITKTYYGRGVDPNMYFWRTSAGMEVDIIVDDAARLIPIEVKLSATPRPGMASKIKLLQKDLGHRVQSGYVVHPGDVRLPLAPDVTAWPFGEF